MKEHTQDERMTKKKRNYVDVFQAELLTEYRARQESLSGSVSTNEKLAAQKKKTDQHFEKVDGEESQGAIERKDSEDSLYKTIR